MNEATLIPLVASAIGGGFAVLGGVVTQAYIAHAGLAKDRKILLRAKGEAVALALIRHEAWFSERERVQDSPDLLQAAPDYLEARAIQRLYLPSETKSMERIGLLLRRMSAFRSDCQERGGIDREDLQEVEQYAQLFHAHQEALHECLDAICLAVQKSAA